MKKTKKIGKKATFLNRIKIGGFLFLVLLSFNFFGNYSQKPQKINTKIIAQTTVSKKPLATPSALLSATPTSKPPTVESAQTQQNSGFCLNVPILLYHHIQLATFDQQMAYLASRGYTAISGTRLIDALRTHSVLPPKSVVITLDDGYKDAYENALPIFRKYNLVGNIMIITGLVGGADYLSWAQIEEMARSGLVYFSSHSWSHYSLTRGSEEKIKFEVKTAKQQLEEHTGQKADIFTYPYGSFDNNVIRILQENGFLGAFSTIPGFTQCDSFIMALHRNRIGNAPLSAYGL